jgi:hypothetical protein
LGWLDSLDHYGLGLWDPGAAEGYVEAGVFGYDDMGFTSFDAEEEQGTNQMWGGSIQGYQQTAAGFDAEQDRGEDMDLHAWEWGGDPMGLEISQEAMHELTGGTTSSAISSTSMISDLVASTDSSPAVQSIAEGPSSNDAPSSSASNDTTSAEEWHCNFNNCGRSFTHRHKLKYVHQTPNLPSLQTNMAQSPQEVSFQALSLS